MQLPTQAQVNTAGRYALAIAGPVIALLGLQAKGFTLDQAKAIISALGDAVNSIVILIGTLGAAYAAVKGVINTSPASQVASVSSLPSVDSKKLASAIADPDLKQAATQAATPQEKP